MTMSRYFFSCLMLLCSYGCLAQQSDSVSHAIRVKDTTDRQLRISFDIARPVIGLFYESRNSYEVMADYYLRNEIYAVVEGGWGSAQVDYDDLKYKTNNIFFRLGIDKTLFPRQKNTDWGAAFIGLRYGMGLIERSDAFYRTDDGYGGVTTGNVPGADFTAHWFEVTGGVRLELLPYLFTGWNIRGKFLLNQKQFRSLQPSFIAGYGQGDKNAVFDFNFYLAYAFRWKRHK